AGASDLFRHTSRRVALVGAVGCGRRPWPERAHLHLDPRHLVRPALLVPRLFLDAPTHDQGALPRQRQSAANSSPTPNRVHPSPRGPFRFPIAPSSTPRPTSV